MKVGWIYDRRFLQHHAGKYHIECPERLEVIVEALEQRGLRPFRKHSATRIQEVIGNLIFADERAMIRGWRVCVSVRFQPNRNVALACSI